MSFDFSSLVTDRTQADVEARNDKGTYQAADLNRVTAAMEELANQFSVLGYSTTGYQRIKAVEHTGGIYGAGVHHKLRHPIHQYWGQSNQQYTGGAADVHKSIRKQDCVWIRCRVDRKRICLGCQLCPLRNKKRELYRA